MRLVNKVVCLGLACVVAFSSFAASETSTQLLSEHRFTERDSVLVVDSSNHAVVEWLPDTARTPASLIKLVTAFLAIEHWGLEHRFSTEFYYRDQQLWVRGLGDPMLISEELDMIVTALKEVLPESPKAINLDSTLFVDPLVPGRGTTDDPYNAPLSALAINFNTVSLQRKHGKVVSGEAQTPLTDVARSLARKSKLSSRSQRVNMRNSELAQRQFAQVLNIKLGSNAKIRLNMAVPKGAKLIYTHQNSHTLTDTLKGALEYSNNFIANQLFILFSAAELHATLSFSAARLMAETELKERFGWRELSIQDGAGLSRDNKMTAKQLMQVLQRLEVNKSLLKRYPLKSHANQSLFAFAKSGTLTGVHSLAGYLAVGDAQYKFVFLFERAMPYRYREQLLQSLANQLADRQTNSEPG